MKNEELAAFQRLSEILDTLRKECPWDRSQTLKSLRYLTIEEVNELSDAIIALEGERLKAGGEHEAGNASHLSPFTTDLKKELGDLAMHILFYCKVAEDKGYFSIADVYNAISDKLVARHPFIYDRENYHGENWEQLKMREGRRNVLEGVPSSLPTLVKAIRMQEKVHGSTDNTAEPTGMSEEEFGQQLFDLVDWGRRHGINADDALSLANRRFAERHSQE